MNTLIIICFLSQGAVKAHILSQQEIREMTTAYQSHGVQILKEVCTNAYGEVPSDQIFTYRKAIHGGHLFREYSDSDLSREINKDAEFLRSKS